MIAINPLRRRLGWTPSDLADMLGSRLSAVNDLVLGFDDPTDAERELLEMFAAADRFDPDIGPRTILLLRKHGRGRALTELRNAVAESKAVAS